MCSNSSGLDMPMPTFPEPFTNKCGTVPVPPIKAAPLVADVVPVP